MSDRDLYRIVPFERLVQLLTTGQLFFSRPSIWDDPYETLVSHAKDERVFAQCWCGRGVSDAMWRIYSPHRLGVRIHTTERRLATEISSSTALDYWKIGKVRYVNPFEYMTEVESLRNALQHKLTNNRIATSLLLKRRAFDHEAEVRAVLVTKDGSVAATRAGISIQVDPIRLIDHVMVDPRAPEEFVDIYRHYLGSKLSFPGVVIKSNLYLSPGIREL